MDRKQALALEGFVAAGGHHQPRPRAAYQARLAPARPRAVAVRSYQDIVVPVAVQPKRPEPVAVPPPAAATPRLQPPILPPLSPEPPSAAATPKAPALAKRHRLKRPPVLYAMAGLIFVIGLIVSLNGLRANRQVAAQVQAVSTASHGSDDNGSKPTTDKPSSGNLAGYAVAPNLPRYLDIGKLGVHARIRSLDVTSSNQLKAPGNVYDAGWYNASAQPGQPGAMLIDGHISSWTTHGVFYGLNKLVAGDNITITRGDNQQFTYHVVQTKLFDAKAVDMSSLLVSQDSAKPGLNLISCSGDVIPGTSEFDKRLVVYTVLQ